MIFLPGFQEAADQLKMTPLSGFSRTHGWVRQQDHWKAMQRNNVVQAGVSWESRAVCRPPVFKQDATCILMSRCRKISHQLLLTIVYTEIVTVTWMHQSQKAELGLHPAPRDPHRAIHLDQSLLPWASPSLQHPFPPGTSQMLCFLSWDKEFSQAHSSPSAEGFISREHRRLLAVLVTAWFSSVTAGFVERQQWWKWMLLSGCRSNNDLYLQTSDKVRVAALLLSIRGGRCQRKYWYTIKSCSRLRRCHFFRDDMAVCFCAVSWFRAARLWKSEQKQSKIMEVRRSGDNITMKSCIIS